MRCSKSVDNSIADKLIKRILFFLISLKANLFKLKIDVQTEKYNIPYKKKLSYLLFSTNSQGLAKSK